MLTSRQYHEGQIKAHEDTIKLFQDYSQNGNSELTMWAKNKLPMQRAQALPMPPPPRCWRGRAASGANGVQGIPPAQRPAEEVLRVALLTEATSADFAQEGAAAGAPSDRPAVISSPTVLPSHRYSVFLPVGCNHSKWSNVYHTGRDQVHHPRR